MKSISFIIATRTAALPRRALRGIQALGLSTASVEVIQTIGSQPSSQRNEAARSAQGELLYFLDDDSQLSSEIEDALALFDNEEVVVVGGPALTDLSASFFERCASAALSSPFGTANTRARNTAVGPCRRVVGEELILCNLMVRREAFLACGGFDARLYPNEENEFLKRLGRGTQLFFYCPSLQVRRPQRKSYYHFLRQMFSYGRGRAQHLFSGFRTQDTFFLLPLAFLGYLASLPFVEWPPYFLPLALYTVLVLMFAISCGIREQELRLVPALILLFPSIHVPYAIGVLWGLLRRDRRSESRMNAPQLRWLEVSAASATEKAYGVAHAS